MSLHDTCHYMAYVTTCCAIVVLRASSQAKLYIYILLGNESYYHAFHIGTIAYLFLIMLDHMLCSSFAPQVSSIDTGPASGYRTHWMQAVQFIPNILTQNGGMVCAGVGHDGVSNVMIDFGLEESREPERDANWIGCANETSALLTQMTDALAGNGQEHFRSATSAMELAAQVCYLTTIFVL